MIAMRVYLLGHSLSVCPITKGCLLPSDILTSPEEHPTFCGGKSLLPKQNTEMKSCSNLLMLRRGPTTLALRCVKCHTHMQIMQLQIARQISDLYLGIHIVLLTAVFCQSSCPVLGSPGPHATILLGLRDPWDHVPMIWDQMQAFFMYIPLILPTLI